MFPDSQGQSLTHGISAGPINSPAPRSIILGEAELPPGLPKDPEDGLDIYQDGIEAWVKFGSKRFKMDGGITLNEFRRYKKAVRELAERADKEKILQEEYNDALVDIYAEMICGPLKRSNPNEPIDPTYLAAMISEFMIVDLAIFFLGLSRATRQGNSAPPSNRPSVGPAGTPRSEPVSSTAGDTTKT